MDRERFEQMRKSLWEVIVNTERLVRALEREEISLATGQFSFVVQLLEELVSFQELQHVTTVVLEEFGLIVSALENGDYVLMADYLRECLLKPLTGLVEELVSGVEVQEEDKKPKPGYKLEYTSSGLVTVSKEVDGCKKYLHGNISPGGDAIDLACRWQTTGVERYIVAGLGLGYQIGELFIRTQAEITVYEEDSEMIDLARRYSDYDWMFENEKIEIIYDKCYNRFAQAAENAEKEAVNPLTGCRATKVCLYYPGITTIRNNKLRENMIRIFSQKDNSERWMNQFMKNICYNVSTVSHFGHELKERMRGKRIFIVAGGPSLDKNLHLLRGRRPEDVVITVGTSLKKCVNDGIDPDYVFTIDPKPDCMYQFQDVLDCNVPMILLSTAYMGVVSRYEGNKYIIFQEGFAPAEQFAKERGVPLFSSGSSVTTTAFDFCIRMEAAEIVFLGLDLANTGGKSHHSGTAERRDTTSEESLVVEDIYGKPVGTTKPFNEYRKWIEDRIKAAKADGTKTRFIDATEGGAKVAGMEIAKLCDVLQ